MSLTMYLHPLASFCHKVLIALYENGTEFRSETVDFGDPGDAARHLERWPVGNIPVLHDAARGVTLPETSIIIEYLDQHYRGPVPMLPGDPEAALEARLWDRFFDLYVHQPMQRIVLDRLRSDDARDATGIAEARATLDTAYAMIESRMAGREWAAGGGFTIAECAATPALFYAAIVHPFGADMPNLNSYFERLLARPSAKRILREARPYFDMFPYRDAMPERFLHD